MNYESVKKPSDLKLEGITIDVEMRDGAPYAVTLTDAKGGHVKIVRNDYSMSILVPAKAKRVKRWAVRGEVRGLKVDENFEEKYQAQQRCDDLNDIGEGFKPEEIEVDEAQ